MVAFYVRQIAVKNAYTLEKVPAYWYNDVKAELIRIGYMQPDPVVETPVEPTPEPVPESTPETPVEETTTTPETTTEDTTTTP